MNTSILNYEELIERKRNFSNTKYNKLIRKLKRYESMSKSELINTLLVLSYWNPDETILEARKKSVFRYGGNNDRHTIIELINVLLSHKNHIQYSKETTEYLKSKKEYRQIDLYCERLIKNMQKIINELETENIYYKENQSIILSNVKFDLLSILDSWMISHQNNQKNILNSQNIFLEENYIDKNLKNQNLSTKKITIELGKELSSFTLEEITAGISYLYKMISKHSRGKPIKRNYLIIPNKKSIRRNKKKYFKLILLASKLQTILEWESNLDFFGYRISSSSKGYRIEDENNILEKSMRLGYSKFEEQRYIYQHIKTKNQADDSITLDKLVERLDPDDFIKNTGIGKRKRYKFDITRNFLELLSNTRFEDQMMELAHLSKEWNLINDELISKPIVGNATLYDILIFTFIFKLISKIISKFIKLNPNLNDNDILGLGEFWLYEKQFYTLMDIFLDREKSSAILDLLTLDSESPVVDLYYTPFIKENNRIGFFVTMVANSNILRNIIQYSFVNNNKTVTNNNGIDGLSNLVYDAFIKNGNFKVIKNLKYKTNKSQREIDVLAISNENVYIIECKNALYPTNSYEVRTSLDHLLKAEKQLALHTEAFNNKEIRKQIEIKIGNKIPNNIVTIIIIGNRLFTGNKNYGNPIRTYFELDNLLNKGYIESSFVRYRLWNYIEFEEQDLLNFLDASKTYIKFYYESLKEVELVIKVGPTNLIFVSYALNQLEVFAKINNSYEKEIVNEVEYNNFLSILNTYET